jgi:hypothetical protein
MLHEKIYKFENKSVERFLRNWPIVGIFRGFLDKSINLNGFLIQILDIFGPK